MALAAVANWGANTVVGLGFPVLQKALGNYSFVPFAAYLAFALAFTVYIVPETKGKMPQQLISEINGGYSKASDGESLLAEESVNY